MKRTERPILCTAAEVRAILDGQQTELRRTMKPQPPPWVTCHLPILDGYASRVDPSRVNDGKLQPQRYFRARCPYFPGVQLWVRETWCCASPMEVVYRADGELADHFPEDHNEGGWRSSTHMPRWASRLTLEVEEVRAERLQEITDKGALAEGFTIETTPALINGEPGKITIFDPRKWFAIRWEALYPGSWERNDWVWVVRFKVATQLTDGEPCWLCDELSTCAYSGESFVCDRCKALVPASRGAADDLPDSCDDCWAAAQTRSRPPQQQIAYTCEMCGGTFEADRTDEEALAEAEQTWAHLGDDPALVCDDCYRKLMEEAPS